MSWIKRFVVFHGKRHPAEMGKAEVEAFLTYLASSRNVADSTQNLALSSILFLYREVLESPLPWLTEVVRAKKPARLPTVLNRQELQAVLARLDDPLLDLVVRLLYGTGMNQRGLARVNFELVCYDGLENRGLSPIVARDVIIQDLTPCDLRAYLSGQHTAAAIAQHFGVHYTTVSRLVIAYEDAVKG